MTKYIVTAWMLIGLAFGSLGIGVCGAWYIQGLRLDSVKNSLAETKLEFKSFKDAVKVLGEEAERTKAARIKEDKEKKEKSDNEYENRIAGLSADVKRMRNERASGSFVPAIATAPGNHDRACFSKTELEQSIRSFDQGIQRLVDQGSADGIGLDVAKRWAQSLKTDDKK